MYDELVQKKKRYAEIFVKSRADGGKSQEYMAQALNVSKTTIKNWEKGVSFPNSFQEEMWFEVLGLNKSPYKFEYEYPELAKSNNRKEALNKMFWNLPDFFTDADRQLLCFLVYGNHGSDWRSVLQMMVAHLQSPISIRAINATLVAQNYEMTKERNELVCPDDIQPNMQIFNTAITAGKKAAINNQRGYMPTNTTLNNIDNDNKSNNNIKE